MGQTSKRIEPETGQHAQPPAAELPLVDGGKAAEGLLHVEDVQAMGTIAQSCHAHVAGDTGGHENDRRCAPTRPEAKHGDLLLTESLAPSLSGTHDSPKGAGEQPDGSMNRAQALRMRQHPPAEEASWLEGPDEDSPATAKTSLVLAPDASAGRIADLVPAAHDDDLSTIATGNRGEDVETTGRQCDIRSQVRHMMDAKLPIALAMREAVEHFKCNETAPNTVPKWPHTLRKGKHKNEHRCRWLRVGRTWKKHAL